MTEQRIRLNLGCGVALLEGFINVDKFYTEEQLLEGARTKEGLCQNAVIQPGYKYVQGDILDLPFPENYADYVLMSHVIEHIPLRYGLRAVQQIHRVLKPGGNCVIMCPDFNSLARIWLDTVAKHEGSFTAFDWYQFTAESIYGNQVTDGEYHRSPITGDYLNFLLKVAGFTNITVTVYPHNGLPATDVEGIVYEDVNKMRLRCGELVARACKPEEPEDPPEDDEEEELPPPPLGISVGDGVGTADGLR